MIFIEHSQNWPQKLLRRRQNRQDNGIPLNPTNAWNSFRGRDELAQNLIKLQQNLCAYCEITLDSEYSYHIEHIKPKSDNPHLTFEYSNLILSCFSSENLPSNASRATLSCGHKKGNSLDEQSFISPTDPHCEHYFQYELNGEISANSDITDLGLIAKVENTIKVLNLNCNRLVRDREAIIDEGFKIINELGLDIQNLQAFIQLELSPVNGKLSSFINLRRQYFGLFKE